MRLQSLFLILAATLASTAYGNSTLTCPPTLTNPGGKLPRGWTLFLPSHNGKAVDPKTVHVSDAKLEAPEFYLGNPRFTSPFPPENGRDENGEQWSWFARGRLQHVGCKYAGTELRVYRTLDPPENACVAPKKPAADGSLSFNCDVR